MLCHVGESQHVLGIENKGITRMCLFVKQYIRLLVLIQVPWNSIIVARVGMRFSHSNKWVYLNL